MSEAEANGVQVAAEHSEAKLAEGVSSEKTEEGAGEDVLAQQEGKSFFRAIHVHHHTSSQLRLSYFNC